MARPSTGLAAGVVLADGAAISAATWREASTLPKTSVGMGVMLRSMNQPWRRVWEKYLGRQSRRSDGRKRWIPARGQIGIEAGSE